jgi:hypothetical protein
MYTLKGTNLSHASFPNFSKQIYREVVVNDLSLLYALRGLQASLDEDIVKNVTK